jgi:hypothetical protein
MLLLLLQVDSYEALQRFVAVVSTGSPVRHFIVHARKCYLQVRWLGLWVQVCSVWLQALFGLIPGVHASCVLAPLDWPPFLAPHSQTHRKCQACPHPAMVDVPLALQPLATALPWT